MAEIADMMIDGTLCAGCGGYMEGEGEGYPRYCAGCRRDHQADAGPAVEKPLTVTPKVECPVCHRFCKISGIYDHWKAQHARPKNV